MGASTREAEWWRPAPVSGRGTGRVMAPFTKAGWGWGRGRGCFPWDDSLWSICRTSVWQAQGQCSPRLALPSARCHWDGVAVCLQLLRPQCPRGSLHQERRRGTPPPAESLLHSCFPPGFEREWTWHRLAGHRGEPSLPRGGWRGPPPSLPP